MKAENRQQCHILDLIPMKSKETLLKGGLLEYNHILKLQENWKQATVSYPRANSYEILKNTVNSKALLIPPGYLIFAEVG